MNSDVGCGVCIIIFLIAGFIIIGGTFGYLLGYKDVQECLCRSVPSAEFNQCRSVSVATFIENYKVIKKKDGE